MSIKLPDGTLLPIAYIDHLAGPILCLKPDSSGRGRALFVGDAYAQRVQQALDEHPEDIVKGDIPDMDARLDALGLGAPPRVEEVVVDE